MPKCQLAARRDIRVMASSDSVLPGGNQAQFRMVVRILAEDGQPLPVSLAVSEKFRVTARQTRPPRQQGVSAVPTGALQGCNFALGSQSDAHKIPGVSATLRALDCLAVLSCGSAAGARVCILYARGYSHNYRTLWPAMILAALLTATVQLQATQRCVAAFTSGAAASHTGQYMQVRCERDLTSMLAHISEEASRRLADLHSVAEEAGLDLKLPPGLHRCASGLS